MKRPNPPQYSSKYRVPRIISGRKLLVRAQSKAGRVVSSTVSKWHSWRNGRRGVSPLLLSTPTLVEKAGRSPFLGSAERPKADHGTRQTTAQGSPGHRCYCRYRPCTQSRGTAHSKDAKCCTSFSPLSEGMG